MTDRPPPECVYSFVLANGYTLEVKPGWHQYLSRYRSPEGKVGGFKAASHTVTALMWALVGPPSSGARKPQGAL